jgi:hypothetical protein
MTRVVNLYKENYDVYVGRRNPSLGIGTTNGKDGYFGNPFPLKPKATEQERKECLEQYRDYFDKRIVEDPEFKQRIEELRGKTLGCFCHPKLCHGDVIVEYLEKENGR